MGSLESFDDIIAAEMLDEAGDVDQPLYAIRILFLNVETSERRSIVLSPSYDQEHVERTRERFITNPDMMLLAFRKEYPKACPYHWSAIGSRTVRLAEIPF